MSSLPSATLTAPRVIKLRGFAKRFPALTVTGADGIPHPVIAAKRKDSFCVIVLREWASAQTPFVVHTFNEQDGGFHHGHYCGTLARAREVFDAKE